MCGSQDGQEGGRAREVLPLGPQERYSASLLCAQPCSSPPGYQLISPGQVCLGPQQRQTKATGEGFQEEGVGRGGSQVEATVLAPARIRISNRGTERVNEGGRRLRVRRVRVNRGSEPRQPGTQLCVSDWARPSERHLRRAGHQQQLGWFGSSQISPTSGSRSTGHPG